MDYRFTPENNIPILPCPELVTVELVDGQPIMLGEITHKTIPLPMQLDGHTEDISFHVTTLSHTPIYLGIPWLQKHNSKVESSIPHIEFNNPCPCQDKISPVLNLPPRPSWEPLKPQRNQIFCAYINLALEEAYVKTDIELPSFFKISKTSLKRKMYTPYQKTGPMIVPLTSKKVQLCHMAPFIFSHKMSPKPCIITSKNILPKASLS